MEVVILQDAKEIGVVAADAIGALLDRKPAAVLGLATGSSPISIYDELAARCDAGLVSFRQARGFTLDEYVGLPADHPQRYRNVIDTAFVSRVDFTPGAVQGPDGLAAESIPMTARILAVAERFEALTAGRGCSRITPAEALEAVFAGSGSEFDPALVDALGKAVRDRSLDLNLPDVALPAAIPA